MPELDIDELDRLAKAATPGPWTAGRHDMQSIVEGCPAKYIYSPLQAVAIACGEDVDWNQVICNAEYIVAACNAVPELISMYRKAKDEANDADAAYQMVDRDNVDLTRHILELRAKVAELERQREWLASQHAKACLDAANDACAWNTGDCPVCPLDKGGRCLEVTSKTFIEAAEKATKEAGE